MNIKAFIKENILSKLDDHTLDVVEKAFGSTLVKIAGIFGGVIVSILLGRTLGAEGLGVITLANRIANILLIVGMLGMQNVLIKEIAIAFEKKDWSHIYNCMNTSYTMNGSFVLVIIIIGIILTPWQINNVFNNEQLYWPLIIAISMICFMLFSRIFSAALIGVGKVWQSNLVNETLSIWVVTILLSIAIIFKFNLNIIVVAIMYAIGRIVVFISVSIYWRKGIPKRISPFNFIGKRLLKTALPLLLITSSGLITANADTIMLGWLSGTKEVGLYSVASRIALLTSFFLQVIASAIAPKIATLYSTKEKAALQLLLQRTTRYIFLLGFGILLVFIIFGKPILSLWGKDFIQAYWVLVVLGFGQFVLLSTGTVGLVLIMTGHEKIQSWISFSFMVLNLILNYFLIKRFGIIGAAFATATTVLMDNIIRTLVVYFKLRINVFSLKFKLS